MAIRVEFYAKDQVTASRVVEFALSTGAVLQGYTEIKAPLAHTKPKDPRTPTLAREMLVKCVSSDNPFRENGARYVAAQMIAKHKKPVTVDALLAEIHGDMDILDSNVRKVLSVMMERDLLVIA